MGIVNGSDRRHVAIVVMADGRRVPVPAPSGLVGVSLPDLLSSIGLALLGLLGLITGSRRETGRTRRDERR